MVIKQNIIVMIDYLFVFTSSNSFFFHTSSNSYCEFKKLNSYNLIDQSQNTVNTNSNKFYSGTHFCYFDETLNTYFFITRTIQHEKRKCIENKTKFLTFTEHAIPYDVFIFTFWFSIVYISNQSTT